MPPHTLHTFAYYM